MKLYLQRNLAPDQGGSAPDENQGEEQLSPQQEEERLRNKGTIGTAAEPSDRDRSSLRRENLDPTFGSEGSIGQSIGSGQKKEPSAGFGPKLDEDEPTKDR